MSKKEKATMVVITMSAVIMGAIAATQVSTRGQTLDLIDSLTRAPVVRNMVGPTAILIIPEGSIATRTPDIPIAVLESSLRRAHVGSFTEFYLRYQGIFWEKVAKEYFNLIQAYYTSPSYDVSIGVFINGTNLIGLLGLTDGRVSPVNHNILPGDIYMSIEDVNSNDTNDYDTSIGPDITPGIVVEKYVSEQGYVSDLPQDLEGATPADIPTDQLPYDTTIQELIAQDPQDGTPVSLRGEDAIGRLNNIIDENSRLVRQHTLEIILPPIGTTNQLYKLLIDGGYLRPGGNPIQALINWLVENNGEITNIANPES